MCGKEAFVAVSESTGYSDQNETTVLRMSQHFRECVWKQDMHSKHCDTHTDTDTYIHIHTHTICQGELFGTPNLCMHVTVF